jgi:hypothetical protein
MKKLRVWLHNASHFHERIMSRFLRSRGWVVFYLEEQARDCNGGVCWMKLYQESEQYRRVASIRSAYEGR